MHSEFFGTVCSFILLIWATVMFPGIAKRDLRCNTTLMRAVIVEVRNGPLAPSFVGNGGLSVGTADLKILWGSGELFHGVFPVMIS
jgi:hypothetical protein